MPPYTSASRTPTEAPALPLAFEPGRVVKLPDDGKFYIDNGESWEEIVVSEYVIGTLGSSALVIDGGLIE